MVDQRLRETGFKGQKFKLFDKGSKDTGSLFDNWSKGDTLAAAQKGTQIKSELDRDYDFEPYALERRV